MRTLLILALAMLSTSVLANHPHSPHSMQQFQSSISTYQQSPPAMVYNSRSSHHGNGTEASEQRTVSAFDAIRIEIPAVIHYQPSDTRSLLVSADANLLDIINTEVVDGVLIISAKDNFSTRLPIQIEVSSQTLKQAFMLAGGQLNISNIKEQSLQLRVTGSGNLKVSGESTVLKTELMGSGTIDGQNLVSQNCQLSLQGSGSIYSSCAEQLSAHLLGSGTIAVSGSPASRQLSGWGAGQILVD